jgi:hypothetical protein
LRAGSSENESFSYLRSSSGGRRIRRFGADAASDSVKSRRADAAVELFGVEFDVVGAMLEGLLADKFVNRCQRLFRFCGQRFMPP